MSCQTIETRFGFYDLYKEKMLFNNTTVSILDRGVEKIKRQMFFRIFMICVRKEKRQCCY